MNTPSEDRFDDHLRRGLDFQPAPIVGGWDRLRGQLPPAPPPAPRGLARLRPFGTGLVVGALLWWGGDAVREPGGAPMPPAPLPTSAPVPRAAQLATPGRLAPGPAGQVVRPMTRMELRRGKAQPGATLAPTLATLPVAVPMKTALARTAPAGLSRSAGPGTPITGSTTSKGGTLATVESRDSLIRQEARAYRTPLAQAADTTRPARLRALIAEQTRALAVLTARLDSVKQFLPEAPPALAVVADTTTRLSTLVPAYSHSLWSVVGLLETTPSWSILPAAPPGADQERTQASLSQSIQLQRDLGSRWRLRAGLGQASLRTQARYVSERTTSTTVNDTVRTTTIQIFNKTRVVKIVQIGTMDTVYTLVQFLDTVRTNYQTMTQRTLTERARLQQLLRPEYRFWTLPLSAQYLLVSHPRWSLGLSVGGQVSVFRGGTVPVWTGDEYVLRQQSARQGPYRPVSLSLSTGLEAQYRITPRLSALLAPMVRGWVVAPGRGAQRSRTLLPAAQVGLSYGF